MANVIIDIAAEFTGKKGFKQAETATDKMTKNVGKLAGALGLAFSGQQILAFGKASIKAAAEDEKAQKQLALALKNVGLGRDVASSEAYIQRLQSEFGILDDKLRPAYQQLAVATQSSTESQRLLNLALDISASTGKDLGSVTSALSKAFLGNNTALSKLGVGISKADLKAKSFKEITDELAVTFAGSATASANTFQGSMDKLGVASANVQEIIGTGLIDAFKNLGDANTVDSLASQMESVALYVADTIRGIGVMIGYIKEASAVISKIPGLNRIMDIVVAKNPILLAITQLNKLGNEAREAAAQTGATAQALAHLAELQSTYAAATLKTKTKLTAEELKALKAAKLKAAIDKAQLALGKGQDVFDMDKIQNAAALVNQTEQLAKATTNTQRLQIANDIARLNVKQSISNLEDAIAAKDEAAIIAATKKLNEDLKILGTLSNQKVTLTDIDSILKGIKPKELIDQKNLDDALAKIAEMMRLLGMANAASKTPVPTSGSLGSGIPAGDFIAPISTAGGSIGAILEYADAATARANAFADLLDMDTAAKTAALQTSANYDNSGALQSFRQKESATYNISIQSGLGDPNAIAEALDQVLREAQQRGTLTTIGAFDR
jgi:hypothetical protein